MTTYKDGPFAMDYTGDCAIPERYQEPKFRIVWAGWSRLEDADRWVGQWVAAAMETRPIRTFYASYPGGEGEFQKGDHFDIQLREGQTHPTWNVGQFDPKTWQYRVGINDAFARLIALLDKEFGKAVSA